MKGLKGFSVLLAIVATLTLADAQRPAPVSHIGIGSRDYTNNIRAADGNVFPDPHPLVESEMGVNVRVVYKKNESPSMILTLENTAGLPLPVQVTFTDFVYVMDDATDQPLSVSPSASSVTVPAFSNGQPGKTTVTVTLSTLPGFVTKGVIWGTVKAVTTQNVYHANGALFIQSGTQVMNQAFPHDRVYCVDQQPKGPQALVWTDLLATACAWGMRHSGDASLAERITVRQYLQWEWQGGIRYTQTDLVTYDLRQAINDPAPTGNCRDFAGFAQLALNALGVEASMMRYKSINSLEFQTNAVRVPSSLPAYPPISSEYSVMEFTYHMVTFVNENVYDSCLRFLLDLDGDVYMFNPVHYGKYNYWQKVNTHPATSNPLDGLYSKHVGLTRRNEPGSGHAAVIADVLPWSISNLVP